MSSGISEYTRRAALLLEAAQRFEESLADRDERDAAARQLLGAAEKDSFAEVRLGFEADTAATQPPPPISGRLAAVLFDLQSANVLVAAGLRADALQAEAHFLEARQEM